MGSERLVRQAVPEVQQTQQAYVYVADDPVNGTDPSGMVGVAGPACSYKHSCPKVKGKSVSIVIKVVKDVGKAVKMVVEGIGNVVNKGTKVISGKLCQVVVSAVGVVGAVPSGAASYAAATGMGAAETSAVEALLGVLAFAGGLGAIGALGTAVVIAYRNC